MGEAKRRRLLDPNYGQAKMPSDLEGIQGDLFSQQSDLVIMSFSDFGDYINHLLNYSMVFSCPSHQNETRHAFVENQQQVMHSIIPLIQEHGKGWITQMYDHRKNYTQWGYVPATGFALRHLQTEVFSSSLGKTVGAVMGCALEQWSFQPSHQLIPVIAMSTYYQDDSWLYCI
jgi:hypothetical protein